MITLLPKFIFADMQPAFYDKDSVTVLELVAKIHGKTNEIVKEYNSFSESVNERVTEFFNSNNEDFEAFKIGLRQEFQDFIDVIDLKILENEQGKEELLTVKATIEKSFANFESMATETLKNQNTKLSNMEQEMLSFTTSVNNQMTNQNNKITKFIDEFEPLERGQVDYNDNDPSSTGHILNRPFWKEEYTNEVLLDTNVAFTLEYMSVNGIGTDNVKEGITYTVTWNNTPYKCKAYKNSGSVLLGNGALMLDSGVSDSGEPFCIEMVTGTAASIIKSTNTVENIALKVEQVGETIYYPIDIRFIPNMYGEIVEMSEAVLCENMPVDESMDNAILLYQPVNLEVGKSYTIAFNGVSYTCNAFSFDIEEGVTAICLGNGAMIGNDDTGEPFLLMTFPPELQGDNGYGVVYIFDGSSIVNISMVLPTKNTRKIDLKYLEQTKIGEGLTSVEKQKIRKNIGAFGGTIFNSVYLNRDYWTEESDGTFKAEVPLSGMNSSYNILFFPNANNGKDYSDNGVYVYDALSDKIIFKANTKPSFGIYGTVIAIY